MWLLSSQCAERPLQGLESVPTPACLQAELLDLPWLKWSLWAYRNLVAFKVRAEGATSGPFLVSQLGLLSASSYLIHITGISWPLRL